jgi:hypothetical protein
METPLCPKCTHPLEVEDPDDKDRAFWWCNGCDSLFAREELDEIPGWEVDEFSRR